MNRSKLNQQAGRLPLFGGVLHQKGCEMMSVTRDEILNMQAGREMDALVHVNIMGLDYRISDGNYDLMYSFCDYAEEGEYINTSGEYADRERVPQYSTDIAAAWKIVEKLQESHYNFQFNISYGPGLKSWQCLMSTLEKTRMAIAPTAPLAISRAALLVDIKHDS